MTQAKPKALILRLSSLGDIVLATAAVEPLVAAGYEVCFVTKKAFAPLLAAHPGISEIHEYDKSDSESAARERLFAWFERREFDLVLDLHDSWRTWSWRRRMRLRAKVYVARKERLREWLIFFLRLGRFFAFGRGGRARKFRRLAEDALHSEGKFVPSRGPLTRLLVTDAESEKVKALLPAGDFAVLLPGSAWKGKEWPYFPQLAAILGKKIPVVALGGEKDIACDAVAKAAGGISLRGRTSLRESMAVLSLARWVIGNDTGMIHVAEALGKDVAMVEGPTHEVMGFSPYRERSLLLGLPLVCRPCSKTGRICPRFGTRKCLKGLSVQRVIELLRAGAYPC